MAGASTTYPASFDAFADGAYDPSIADAVNRVEAGNQIYPPAAVSTTTNPVIANTVEDGAITTTLLLTTGTVQATLIGLVKNQVITNIQLNSGAASVAQTHLWGAITSVGTSSTATVATVLAVTADGGTVPSAATAVQKLALTSQWTVPSTGLYYVHVLAVATTTMPTFDAALATAGVRATQYPIIAGTGSTGASVAPTVGASLGIPVSGGVTKALAVWLS